MAKYYNAIVKTDYGAAITYHQITTVKDFIRWANNNLSVVHIYFYLLPYRQAEKGEYDFTYSAKYNNITDKHGNRFSL